MQHTITLSQAIARNPQLRLAAPVDLQLNDGEQLAIVGPNGAGKSLLVDLLTGKLPLLQGFPTYDFRPSASSMAYDNIKYIAFRDTYGSADANYYYQQRWNQTEQDDVPLVRELLGGHTNDEVRNRLFRLFGLEPLLDKKIILLSSGELRKFQLTKALLSSPRILIMDNPFIGLDATTRQMLSQLMEELTQQFPLQIVLVLSMMEDVPTFITHVVPVDSMRVGEKTERGKYLEKFAAADAVRRKEDETEYVTTDALVAAVPYQGTNFSGSEVVKLNKVSIRYDDRTILSELDWLVQRGEKWALSGDNGSGKSTLLSLICADNPQSYACDISLFGRRRGTGESIWEIKQHIGYVSPEMHRAYLKNLPTIEIVASGLHDSIGLYVRPKPEELEQCMRWMEIFGIGALKERPFLQLSSGEQRLALLARAFVRDPELLILDEPLHGLDTYNRRRVKRIIEAFCRREDKTLIMVTHYANELPSCITHRIHLKKPRVR
ncbi:MAG: ATP-binding cassette domain-containing protein [Mediterranea sp.]|nr:ATP-binding cassette domain-containing protein [Mediterranea sp.]